LTNYFSVSNTYSGSITRFRPALVFERSTAPPLNEFDSKYRFLMYIFVHENMCIKSSNNFINIRYTSFNLHLIYHDSNIVFLIEVKISFKIKHFLFWHLTESATLLNESSTRQVGDYVSKGKSYDAFLL